jgi:hypothetical protein
MAESVPPTAEPDLPPEPKGEPDTESDTVQAGPPPEPVADVPVSHVPPSREGPAIDLMGAYRLHGWFFNNVTLAVAGVLLVLGIASLATHFGKRTVFMPGAVSAKHASFVNECVRCHNPGQTLHTQVSDARCESCHKLPTHFGDRSAVPTPSCTACHLVHKGSTILANATGRDCLRCHMDLKVKNPTADIATSITDFSISHPEFAITVQEGGEMVRIRLNDTLRLKDASMIKLNHRLHLDPELPGLASGPLQCVNCHQQAERQTALVPPVKYESACMQCHALDFDSKYPEKAVAHGKQPQVIDADLKILYSGAWLSMGAQAEGSLPSQREDWIQERVEKAEAKLFGKKGMRSPGKCQLCHVIDASGASELSFPLIAQPSIPKRWFINGTFNHAAHTVSKCIDCHEAAVHSEATADVLLPKVSTCRQCHNDRGTARATCLECHQFHESPRKAHARVSTSTGGGPVLLDPPPEPTSAP